jgi:hypothetical protein
VKNCRCKRPLDSEIESPKLYDHNHIADTDKFRNIFGAIVRSTLVVLSRYDAYECH